MRTYKANVTLECRYQRHRPEGTFAFPEGPQPWTGEWQETSRTPVENNLEGTAHVCTITYETEIDLWTPDREKAEAMLHTATRPLSSSSIITWINLSPLRVMS